MRLLALTTVSLLITAPAMAASKPLQATSIPTFGEICLGIVPILIMLALVGLLFLRGKPAAPKAAATQVPPHLRDDVGTH